MKKDFDLFRKAAIFILFMVLIFIVYSRFLYHSKPIWWGELILLETLPLDPKDIFRGDHVQLKYEISTIDLNKLNVNDSFKKDEKIYVILEKYADGTYKAVAVSKGTERPERSKKFIQGTIVNIEPNHNIGVKYGIESYFVQKGKGKVMEAAHNEEKLKVLIVLDNRGRSTIRRLLRDEKNGLIEIQQY